MLSFKEWLYENELLEQEIYESDDYFNLISRKLNLICRNKKALELFDDLCGQSNCDLTNSKNINDAVGQCLDALGDINVLRKLRITKKAVEVLYDSLNKIRHGMFRDA